MTLDEAIAVWNKPGSHDWTAISVILNAVASGDMIPLADHKLAVALVVEKATVYSINESRTLALADTDPLAEVRALKAERDVWRSKLDHMTKCERDQRYRAEAAEAEVQKMRAALSTLNDKDMCQMGQAPCDWALRLIAEKEAAEAEVVELEETIKDLKFELNWIKDKYDD